MTIPIAATFSMTTQSRRIWLAAATVAIGLILPVGVVRSVLGSDFEPFQKSLMWFAYSLLAMQIGSSVLAARPVRQ